MKRAFHATAFHNSTIYIFGGADGTKRFSDMWGYKLRDNPPSLTVLAAMSPSMTPIATPQRSRRPSVTRSRLGSGFCKTPSIEDSIGSNRGSFVTAESVLAAFNIGGKDSESDKESNRQKKVSPFSNRSKMKTNSRQTSCEVSPEEIFVVPGEGLLPAEVLNGIQSLRLGVNSFSHGPQHHSPVPSIDQMKVPYA